MDNLLTRFNFLFNAVRNGRLDVKYRGMSIGWLYLKSMTLGEILSDLERNRFEYDGEII